MDAKKTIPPVSADLMMCVARKFAEDSAAGLQPEPTILVITALHEMCGSEEMIAIQLRLTALCNLIIDGDGTAWTINVNGKDYTLVHEALCRAVATAPLTATKMVGDLRFGPEILDIALRDADPSGSA